MRRTLIAIFLMGLVAASFSARGADVRLATIKSNPDLLRAAQQAGKKAAFFCVNCHGESGVSRLSDVPNLAGQNADYLLEQTRKFGDGRRKDPFMQGLIKVLSEEEKIQISLFYAGQMVPPGKADIGLVAQGKRLYAQLCQRCHGNEARGDEIIARLAGQHPEYLILSVTRYRDRTGERIDPLMFSVVASLKDTEIKALAAYLYSLP
jgi:cytochrome c553